MQQAQRLAVAVLCGLGAAAGLGAEERQPLERSVVRILNYAQHGDWYSPWRAGEVRASSGSGFVIEGGVVLTNAHVVSDARLVLLFLHNDPEPHPAVVYRIAHDADLALLRPQEAHLLDQTPALRLGQGLPPLGSTVETLGYPAGGTGVSSTRGVVSRIEEQQYQHSASDRHLAVQTDAAINPGNSGGPVVQDGQVIGVAFQAYANMQNVGYFIPAEVVARFLADAADGTYDGYPDLGLRCADLENPAARQKLGLGPAETGVLVDRVTPSMPSAQLVAEGDVLLEVDGHVVANDGSVADSDLRFAFGLLIDRHQVGEQAALRILRAGERQTIRVPLGLHPAHARHGNVYDALPRYLIYGGLVFVPLDLEMLKTFGDEWQSKADRLLLDEFIFRPLADPSLYAAERVVLLRRLDHPVNAHIPWYRNQLVSKVNGREIRSLAELASALSEGTGTHQLIELAHERRFVVLDRAAAEQAHDEILEKYGVERDRRL